MRTYQDSTGSYDLDQVVAITPVYMRASARGKAAQAPSRKLARLHLASGAELVTAGDYATIVAQWAPSAPAAASLAATSGSAKPAKA